MADGVEDTDTFRQEQVRAWMDVGLFNLPPPLVSGLLNGVGQTWLADVLAEAAPAIEQQQLEQQMMMQAEQDAALQREDQVRAEDAEREDQRRAEDRGAAVEDQQAQAMMQQRKDASAMAQTAVRALLSGSGGQKK